MDLSLPKLTHIRFATYLSPSFPIEFYELVMHYIEKKLGVHTSLLYESRWPGSPEGRPEPFTENQVDIAFVNSISYLHLVDSKNPYVELLPVTSVHIHKRGEGKPGYFADVIVHNDRKEEIKEFLDLRGCKWAYNDNSSLSGNLITLETLKKMGENTTFFGNLLASGSHLKSIKMVTEKQVDAAAVDSNCLAYFVNNNPEYKKEFFCLDSWGPLPPYPILVNSRLQSDLKGKIVSALLDMGKDPHWNKELKKFGVLSFAPNDPFIYDQERDLIKNVKNLKPGSIYY